MNKTIFITGASSGLGNAAAKLFQSKGWNVIATMRNPEKESGLGQLKNVTLLALDVTNAEQIDKTVQEVIASGEVDVVFNNAGYGLMGSIGSFKRRSDHPSAQHQFIRCDAGNKGIHSIFQIQEKWNFHYYHL